jgi:adenosylcobinamide kinase / adenosylcobinamide-phosphate guanylyltransferase
MKTLLIGGARSGKSALALRRVNERSSNVCVIVTATGSDPEMAARIEAHRRERPSHWRLREEPVQLGRALREEGAPDRSSGRPPVILVDCLTLWVSNCLWPDGEVWRRERTDFLEALRDCSAEVVIVTNEVGTGIVPDNTAGRTFRDEQGWLNQAAAAQCDEVLFVTAGLAMRLKPASFGPGA